MKKHTIVYAHGFGVRKDERGMFTDIAAAFPNANHAMFDLDICNDEENTVTIRPFRDQVALLNKKIGEVTASDPDTIIDVVAHSRGCKVVAMADLSRVRKVVFITPPIDSSIDRTIERFKNTPGAILDMNGESRIPRKDGSTTIFPKEYWTDPESNKTLIDDYLTQVGKTDIIFIKAAQDDVLGDVNLSVLEPSGKVVTLDGDHNFSGSNRAELVEKIQEFLNFI